MRELAGLLRSLVIYYGQFWRNANRRRFYGQFVRAGSLCFDIGAHVGDRVRTFRQLGARVVAVEPQPLLQTVLRALYGRDRDVVLRSLGVGSVAGRLTLSVSSRSPTLSTLSKDWIAEVQADQRFRSTEWDRQLEIEVTTLDALVARYGAPAFCKIDVEGFEQHVLQGLSTPLAALSFEYIPVSVERAVACVTRLTELGNYEFRHSVRETMRWADPRWLSAAEICAGLRALPLEDPSGDVYARLIS